jgi:hypothetical protein
MNKRVILFLLLPLVFIQCKRLSEFTKFDLTYDETVVIPATLGINLPFNIFTPPINTENQSEFAVNDTRKDLIEEITLTTLELSITSPERGDFRFLRSIEIYIEADSLDEILVAWNYDVPADADQYLELETSTNDLQEYIKKDAFNLRVKTKTDQIIESDHEILIHSVFFVDARILGL